MACLAEKTRAIRCHLPRGQRGFQGLNIRLSAFLQGIRVLKGAKQIIERE